MDGKKDTDESKPFLRDIRMLYVHVVSNSLIFLQISQLLFHMLATFYLSSFLPSHDNFNKLCFEQYHKMWCGPMWSYTGWLFESCCIYIVFKRAINHLWTTADALYKTLCKCYSLGWMVRCVLRTQLKVCLATYQEVWQNASFSRTHLKVCEI